MRKLLYSTSLCLMAMSTAPLAYAGNGSEKPLDPTPQLTSTTSQDPQDSDNSNDPDYTPKHTDVSAGIFGTAIVAPHSILNESEDGLRGRAEFFDINDNTGMISRGQVQASVGLAQFQNSPGLYLDGKILLGVGRTTRPDANGNAKYFLITGEADKEFSSTPQAQNATGTGTNTNDPNVWYSNTHLSAEIEAGLRKENSDDDYLLGAVLMAEHSVKKVQNYAYGPADSTGASTRVDGNSERLAENRFTVGPRFTAYLANSVKFGVQALAGANAVGQGVFQYGVSLTARPHPNAEISFEYNEVDTFGSNGKNGKFFGNGSGVDHVYSLGARYAFGAE